MEEPTKTTPLTQHTDDDDDDDTGDDNQVIEWDNIDLGQVPADGTPAGEQIPLNTITRGPQEQQGSRNAETSFNEGSQSRQAIAESQQETVWEEIEWDFPEPDKNKLDVRRVAAPRSGQGRGGSVIELSLKGRDKWYRFYTKSPGDTKATFNEHLPQAINNALGKTTDELFSETNAALARNQQELAEKQAQLKQIEQRADESQKLKREMDALHQSNQRC